MKLEPGVVQDRARRFGQGAAVLTIVLFAAGGMLVAWSGMGFAQVGAVDPGGPSNPHLTQTVARAGGWLTNFAGHPWMLTAPILGFVGPLVALVALRGRRSVLVFAGSSLAVIGIIATVGLSMFPFILPSSIDPDSSLTVWNASSSHGTLFTMLLVTAVFLPIVLLYTSWAYRVMFGRVTTAQVRGNPDFY